MIVDISDKRREWYDESYDPSPQPRLVRGASITFVTGRQFGKLQAIAEHLSATDRIIQQNFIQPMTDAFSHVAGTLGMSTVPAGESVQDRALRLKQQPHSMAQNPNALHFDHRGRHRY